ncbi:MAG: hypothetical protein HOP12_08495 [Candidatus Eisenbacteria bacterium]|uniref:T9SS type A sorting domain-containing protein n=1 Tax=Eiseniibacteriota bacterium TaxID=2212470 RepID=A0A849SID5_UNCEI|nr:hypothetical protein [Candidatus Eisenbacteria bacterium]
MRVHLQAAMLLFALSAASFGEARAERPLIVRRALPAEQAAELAKRGTPWRGAILPADVAAAQRERARLQRSFPGVLAPKNFDWSRGPGAPTFPGRNPNARVREARPRTLGNPPLQKRVAFIRIDFATDRAGSETSGDGRFNLSAPDTLLPPLDRPPHNRSFYQAHFEALRRYYDAQSYGRVQVVGDVWPREENSAYRFTDHADLGPWKFSQDIYGAAVDMTRHFFFAADTQSVQRGDRIPWDDYDYFVFIHAGSDFQSDVRQDSPLDIPSFTIGMTDADQVVFSDSLNRPIGLATFVPETASQDGFFATINGVLAHECGHLLFGFADLYDVNSGYPVVGLWSLMDSGNLAGTQVQTSNGDIFYAIGLLPPSVDPFQRYFTTDALEFVDVAWADTMVVANSERNPDMRRVWLTSDEYLLIENRHIAAGDTLDLDQDDSTRVILGPRTPDPFEYDALLPGSGLLIWHIDAAVIPFETALRPNPGFGFNTDFRRPGISVVEADALRDLGDPSSPYILGSPRDPWFVTNNTVLSDTTRPNLRPHIGSRPHVRLEVLDEPGLSMRLLAQRSWSLPAWPLQVDGPPEGPQLLAIDVDGDSDLEVCWAGGGATSQDSTGIFAVRTSGDGVTGGSLTITNLDRRPRPPLAAIATAGTSSGALAPGPAVFAVATYADGPDLSTPGGRVWLIDHQGVTVAGWPAALPSLATTAPVIVGVWPAARIYVGAADGRVYGLDAQAQIVWTSAQTVSGGVSGRLAVRYEGTAGDWVAFGGSNGELAVELTQPIVCGVAPCPTGSYRVSLASAAAPFVPDLAWVDFRASASSSAAPAVVVHAANRLWAYDEFGAALPGWGGAAPDTIVSGLALGDPDADGLSEVVARTRSLGIAYWNVTGSPAPGWPEPTSREVIPSLSAPLVVDVDGDQRVEMISIDGGGVVSALNGAGRQPEGWPLATGSGASGTGVAVDLDLDGTLELVLPDRVLVDSLQAGINGRFSSLQAFSLPGDVSGQPATSRSWPMLGGDPGRSSTLPVARAAVPPVASSGPLVDGSVIAYPNPAKRKPVMIAYRLTEPAHVTFDILDSSGHRVESFEREGRISDNLERWDPGQVAAGLYLVRVRARGASGDREAVIPVGVLR